MCSPLASAFGMSDDNPPLQDNIDRVYPLKLAHRKKPWVYRSATHMNVLIQWFSLSRAGDPLVHHGRHFGRTVYAMCSVHALITSALARMAEEEDIPEESLTFEFVEWFISFLFKLTSLCQTQGPEGAPGISKALAVGTSSLWASHGGDWRGHQGDGRLGASITQDLQKISHLQKLQKGVSSARSDDTKSLKGIVVDWITPRDGPLLPPLSRNVKMNRGFHHPVTGGLLCPAGLDWNDDE